MTRRLLRVILWPWATLTPLAAALPLLLLAFLILGAVPEMLGAIGVAVCDVARNSFAHQ